MGKTKNYLQDLYRQSRKEVQKEFGTRGAVMLLALKFGLTAIGVGLFSVLSLSGSDSPIYKTVFNIFAGDIVGLIILFIITPAYSVLKMPQLAATRDGEQKERISELERNTKSADKIYLEKDGDENTGWTIVIHNGDNEKFDGYLKVWKVNNERLLLPIKLGYIHDNNGFTSIVSDIHLFRDESTTFGFVFMDKKNKLPIIIGEGSEGVHLEKKRNIVETKLFGQFGTVEIIPKNIKWEIRLLPSGKMKLQKIQDLESVDEN